MNYFIRSNSDGYFVNGRLIGISIADMRKRFKGNRDIQPVLSAACKYADMREVYYVKLSKTDSGTWVAAPVMYDAD